MSRSACLACLLLVLADCSDDTRPPLPPIDRGGQAIDARRLPDRGVRIEAGGCRIDQPSCGSTELWCEFGKCVPCPVGRLNCNHTDSCECTGSCDGESCRGSTACEYLDENACGGDPTKWCYLNKCESCSWGFNCNNTKGCECDTKGCDGKLCLGTCSGGECN